MRFSRRIQDRSFFPQWGQAFQSFSTGLEQLGQTVLKAAPQYGQ